MIIFMFSNNKNFFESSTKKPVPYSIEGCMIVFNEKLY